MSNYGFRSITLLLQLFSIAFNLLSVTHATIGSEEIGGGIGRRARLSLIETPRGSNATFECSPAGPCVPCLYSEKKDEKYRCGETVYHIPLKCVETKHGSKEAKKKGTEESRSTLEISHAVEDSHNAEELRAYVKHRSLLDDSSTQEPQAYITYRSCLPAVNEEKLSVLGFEAIMLFLLLISGSLIYFRRKQTASTAGLLNSEQLQVLSVPFWKLIRAASNCTVDRLQFHTLDSFSRVKRALFSILSVCSAIFLIQRIILWLRM